jgi:hypothetical protein
MTRPALALLLLAACGPARVETDPASLQLFGRGQRATVRATPFSRCGRPLADACAWSSSDERVARVQARHNEATVTAQGHGRATVRCAVGGVAAEVPVTVTVVSRLEVAPARLALRLEDQPAPTPLAVRAFDGDGREVQGRAVATRCLDEAVCRGDGRGQVWPVGPGATTAQVVVEDGESAVAVEVADARSAAGKPRAVKGNPMEGIDPPAAPARGKARAR